MYTGVFLERPRASMSKLFLLCYPNNIHDSCLPPFPVLDEQVESD